MLSNILNLSFHTKTELFKSLHVTGDFENILFSKSPTLLTWRISFKKLTCLAIRLKGTGENGIACSRICQVLLMFYRKTLNINAYVQFLICIQQTRVITDPPLFSHTMSVRLSVRKTKTRNKTTWGLTKNFIDPPLENFGTYVVKKKQIFFTPPPLGRSDPAPVWAWGVLNSQDFIV